MSRLRCVYGVSSFHDKNGHTLSLHRSRTSVRLKLSSTGGGGGWLAELLVPGNRDRTGEPRIFQVLFA